MENHNSATKQEASLVAISGNNSYNDTEFHWPLRTEEQNTFTFMDMLKYIHNSNDKIKSGNMGGWRGLAERR